MATETLSSYTFHTYLTQIDDNAQTIIKFGHIYISAPGCFVLLSFSLLSARIACPMLGKRSAADLHPRPHHTFCLWDKISLTVSSCLSLSNSFRPVVPSSEGSAVWQGWNSLLFFLFFPFPLGGWNTLPWDPTSHPGSFSKETLWMSLLPFKTIT